MCAGRVVCPGKRGGDRVGRTRGGTTSKWHIVCDGNDVPLAVHLADGRPHDLTQAEVTLAALRMPRRRGCPWTRPGGLAADKGYWSTPHRLHSALSIEAPSSSSWH